MTHMFKAGDRVTIDWDTVYQKHLNQVTYGLIHFKDHIECYGTVKQDARYTDESLIIEWDEEYHDYMYRNNQWNLVQKVVKLVEPVDPKKAIEARIKRTYAKSKLPFVQNWSK